MEWGSMAGAFSGSGGYSFGSADQDDLASGNVGDSAGQWQGSTVNKTVNFGDNPFMPSSTGNAIGNYMPHLLIGAGVLAVALILRGK